MLCKGNLAHGGNVPWCLGEAGEDGLCAAHRAYPLYRPGSRGPAAMNAAAAKVVEEGAPKRRRKSTKNPADKGETS